MEKGNQDSQTSLPVSAKSAFKSLELILHNINHQALPATKALLNDNSQLTNAQKLRLTNLKESLTQIDQLINQTLKTNSTEEFELNIFHDPEVGTRLQVEKVLRALATTTSVTDSQSFYKYCVKTLAELYQCKFAFIGLIQPSGNRVLTHAVWAGDNYANNFEYDLKGTPCADIISFEKELIPTDASKLYPDDELLVNMNVDSYFGAPIISKDKGVIGLISVMNTKPMRPDDWSSPVLSVFAARLAMEIERKEILEDLKELNQSLEKKVAERTERLEFINQELQSFCYSVSHDLRAPVRTIKSFTNILAEEHNDELSVEAQQLLQRITRASTKVDDLIVDILALSNVAQTEMIYSNVKLSQLIENELQILCDSEEKTDKQVTIDQDMKIWGDERLLKILIQNLLSNAWKYTSKTQNARIELGSLQNEKYDMPVFFVRDNGVGFDMAYADKLFKPFQRLHHENDFSGNGVGLATVQRVITRHGGKIWAESEPNKETCFYFTLGENKAIC